MLIDLFLQIFIIHFLIKKRTLDIFLYPIEIARMPSFKENLKNLDKLSYIFMLVNFLSWAPFEAIALYSKGTNLSFQI